MPVGDASRASFSTFSKSPRSIWPSKTTRLPFGCNVTLAANAGAASHKAIRSEANALRRMAFDAETQGRRFSLAPAVACRRRVLPAAPGQTQGSEYVFTFVKLLIASCTPPL